MSKERKSATVTDKFTYVNGELETVGKYLKHLLYPTLPYYLNLDDITHQKS